MGACATACAVDPSNDGTGLNPTRMNGKPAVMEALKHIATVDNPNPQACAAWFIACRHLSIKGRNKLSAIGGAIVNATMEAALSACDGINPVTVIGCLREGFQQGEVC
jgi:hypothetical protein